MFLDKHEEQADKEKDCYGYCMAQAIEHFAHADFEKAAIYHENIVRSLRELQALKNEKLQVDKSTQEILEQKEQQKMVDFWRGQV